jgi:hypothetical protein
MSVVEAARLTPDLVRFGKKIHSQNDEDGIIERIVSDLHISTGYFVEFGVGPPWGHKLSESGLEANCRRLQERGWQGLFMDAAEYAPELGVVRETITPFNVNRIMRKHGVAEEFDVLSVDIDGQDFWVWMNLLARPRLVIVEYNSSLALERSCVIPPLSDFVWDGTDWFGASLGALDKLAESRFYKLVYANGVNAFFVRSDLFSNHGDFSIERLYVSRIIHPRDPRNREFLAI